MNKILIIDDNYAIRLLYQEELTDEGYRVSATNPGNDISMLIKQDRPDVVILDNVVSEFDGIKILQEIRNADDNIPVILCSAYSPFKHEEKSITADYYVTKSHDLSELKMRINMALEARRAISLDDLENPNS